MIKVYTGPLLNFKYLPVLYPNLGLQTKASHLFINNAFKYLTEPAFQLIENIAQAEYLLIPHDYFLVARNAPAYLEQFRQLAQTHGKKILAFTHTDIEEPVSYPEIIIFRISQYRYQHRANEILMPPYADDLLAGGTLSLRHKKPNQRPVVGFCGWAKMDKPRDWAAYYVKIAGSTVRDFLKRRPEGAVKRSGIWWRRKVLPVLEKSFLVETNFVIRDSFGAHQDTIKIDPERARKEYIENMLNSDLALAIKGGGNNSLRFYEALSLGRIPVLVDTECLLPLPDIIDYKKFALIVSYQDIDKLDAIIADWYNQLSDDDFVEMQRRAREAFANYLRIDSFFKHIPDLLKRNKEAQTYGQ